jgi:hypothetical protein
MPKILGTKDRIDRCYNPTEKGPQTMDTPEEKITPEPEKRPPTVQEIEEYFTTQGELIEAQLHDGGAYPNCPVCTHAKQSLEGIVKLLRASLTALDEAKEADFKDGTISTIGAYDRMRTELPWFELAKSIALVMTQAGHIPEKVMNQHPALAISRGQKRVIKSSKHKRQLARAARRNNR